MGEDATSGESFNENMTQSPTRLWMRLNIDKSLFEAALSGFGVTFYFHCI